MAVCEFKRECVVFSEVLDRMPHTAMRYREHYCSASPHECARFRLARALGSDRVPASLLPNQDSVAQNILMALR